jgi:hypothetical protein
MRKLFIALIVLASMASVPAFAGPLAQAADHVHASAGGIPGR